MIDPSGSTLRRRSAPTPWTSRTTCDRGWGTSANDNRRMYRAGSPNVCSNYSALPKEVGGRSRIACPPPWYRAWNEKPVPCSTRREGRWALCPSSSGGDRRASRARRRRWWGLCRSPRRRAARANSRVCGVRVSDRLSRPIALCRLERPIPRCLRGLSPEPSQRVGPDGDALALRRLLGRRVGARSSCALHVHSLSSSCLRKAVYFLSGMGSSAPSVMVTRKRWTLRT